MIISLPEATNLDLLTNLQAENWLNNFSLISENRTLFKISSWNIEGRKGKCTDSLFVNYIKKYDIILLQETWALDQVLLGGYKVYC